MLHEIEFGPENMHKIQCYTKLLPRKEIEFTFNLPMTMIDQHDRIIELILTIQCFSISCLHVSWGK
jgi:hypothetical protein